MSGWTTQDDECDPEKKPKGERECFKVCRHHGYQVSWIAGEWSQCLQRRDVHLCSDPYGIQHRKVKCAYLCDNTSVPSHVCSHFHPLPPSSRYCRLPCPQNCIITEQYGEWSHCPQNCSSKVQTRHKHMLLPPSDGGRSCYEAFEGKPCKMPQCPDRIFSGDYMYRVGAWGNCTQFRRKRRQKLQTSISTVIGLQSRTVECIDGDGNAATKK